MESQPIKGATYAIASAFRLVSAFRYITASRAGPPGLGLQGWASRDAK
ncbi:unnamed protein product [Penicillium camemberti]|uniref:Str. FM013 n=1 Tax=Penicillium camemberti (strain FM 013) TaxID=1429867 RepID=A0A0G4NT63_PENC3|nr:unnamed protein product [Penicillium camemberti]